MFKQVKSIFIWSMVYRFRRRLVVIVILLSIVMLSQWIYSDVVEYLTLRELTSYLDIVLPLKWGIVFFSIALSTYLVLGIFKNTKKDEQKKRIVKPKTEGLTEREKSFITKELRSEAEILLQKK